MVLVSALAQPMSFLRNVSNQFVRPKLSKDDYPHEKSAQSGEENCTNDMDIALPGVRKRDLFCSPIYGLLIDKDILRMNDEDAWR